MKPWKGSAAAVGLASCHTCQRVTPVAEGRCPRCGDRLHLRDHAGTQRALALLIASIILYIPANVMPIMIVEQIGAGEKKDTILTGVATFWEMKAYPIAITIFVASVVIPALKMLALGWLCAASTGWVAIKPKGLTRIYWLTELVGRWSMVDVFVVAILVALIQLGNLMSVHPGPGALAFCGVVILTMFAAMSFDPRLLWDRAYEEAEHREGKELDTENGIAPGPDEEMIPQPPR